jgi:phage tail sheath protein FI
VRDNYSTIFQIFANFCENLRKDCLFIADPLRQIFVTGANSLVMSDTTRSFSQYIYNPLRHLFGTANTSYATTYGNWVKVNDMFAGMNIWVPFSPFAAADMANVDQNFEPWYAPAGFIRGKVTNALALAINPSQKNRDMIYKACVNPVVFFPNDGFNIFGQKTLLRQPSAFDRINVRRLFLYLEKATKRTVKYFVFEPNTMFTRNRVVAVLDPIFERAKNTQGLYSYIIICNSSNNTPTVIDQNELVVDIYLKPVRAAEFILVNFYATSTGANFSELIGQ